MINDLVNNIQIKLLEGPDSLIDFAFSKKFNEHLKASANIALWCCTPQSTLVKEARRTRRLPASAIGLPQATGARRLKH